MHTSQSVAPQQTSLSRQLDYPFFTFVLIGSAFLLIYIAAWSRFPLLGFYTHPIQNLDKITDSDIATGFMITGSLTLLFAGYALGAMVLYSLPRRNIFVCCTILVLPCAFVGVLLFVHPSTSIDVYDYLFRGRMLASYEANTFVQVPRDFEEDPLFKYVAWRGAVTAYGPLWERMSWVTARLAGEAPTNSASATALLPLLFAYKILAALGFLLCGVAIWGALGLISPSQRWFGIYLWLWNPLVLWESVAAAHNDAWMALAIIVAVWTLAPRHKSSTYDRVSPSIPAAGLLSLQALTLGGLIKYLTWFLGPLALAASLRRLPTWRLRWRLVLLGGVICSAFVVVAYAQFWSGWDTFRNIGARGNLFTASWLASFQTYLETRIDEDYSKQLASLIGAALLALGMLWATWRSWQAPMKIAEHMLWLLLWFLFVCNPWFQPWYLIWLVALVALQPWRTQMLWGVGTFCLTAMLSYSAVAFLLPILDWERSGWVWNGLISLIIYLPPLFVLSWGFWNKGVSQPQPSPRPPHIVVPR
ncbi:MAG: hypothetical protein GFH27_549283n317 [Chloroflexi bacterium AL-W]|nr:hypothetical protein [Chloroflexi bacterium AL-N1]NOK64561.1 hypothetical protein [Chloroflexi bacterium AL-N10]NOK75803.1 hypothetical protein [Chloroflexi bacterium AL-N5]NOK80438.1 hypothetical protein [Chloroflexi bacterium AL-W]NOK86952.1 hypothetical protein [Chloroflexi bacterium AL-N15]